jgi:hypothetical protein
MSRIMQRIKKLATHFLISLLTSGSAHSAPLRGNSWIGSGSTKKIKGSELQRHSLAS